MARIYANLIILGYKTLEDVPLKIRDEVEIVLKEKIAEGFGQ